MRWLALCLCLGGCVIPLELLGHDAGSDAGPTALFASQLSVGEHHTCVLTPERAAYCFGRNSLNQLGVGDTAVHRRPVRVPTGAFALTALMAGADHTCALTQEGQAVCWGANNHGQLGTGDFTAVPGPVAVNTALRFKQLAAGDEFNCGITQADELHCWGSNVEGQLGLADENNPVEHSSVPLRVGVEHYQQVAGARDTPAPFSGQASFSAGAATPTPSWARRCQACSVAGRPSSRWRDPGWPWRGVRVRPARFEATPRSGAPESWWSHRRRRFRSAPTLSGPASASIGTTSVANGRASRGAGGAASRASWAWATRPTARCRPAFRATGPTWLSAGGIPAGSTRRARCGAGATTGSSRWEPTRANPTSSPLRRSSSNSAGTLQPFGHFSGKRIDGTGGYSGVVGLVAADGRGTAVFEPRPDGQGGAVGQTQTALPKESMAWSWMP